MRRLTGLVVALLPRLAAAGDPAADESLRWVERPLCPVAHRAIVDHLSTIALDAETLTPPLRAVVERAAAMWNDAGCNPGARFPRFVVGAGAAADRHVEVVWQPGPSTIDPTACGRFAGRRIELFGRARDPVTGLVRDCGSRSRVAETLAHELGHLLGLVDQTSPGCGEHIMSGLARDAGGSLRPRWVQPAECLAADRKFETVAERRPEPWRGELPLVVAAWAGGLPQP